MARRFPNPIPSGTRVPRWALIDITVRCYVFFNGNIFTAPSAGSLGTIGTLISLLQSVVRTFPIFLTINVSPTSCFLDTPEQVPGVLLGPSGATVSASGTRSGATSSLFGGPSSTVGPTPASTSKSNSNTGAIVGGAVGGVVIIALAAIAIGYFMRRRRPEAPAPVAPPAFGASQPPMDEIQQPLTNEVYAASIPGTIGSSIPGTPGASMRIYVRVSSTITRRTAMCAHRMRFLTLLTLRTRMIHLHSLGTKEFRRRRPRLFKEMYSRSLGTKGFHRRRPRLLKGPYSHSLDTKELHRCRPRLLKEAYRRSMEQETPWPRCRPHGFRVITAYLLYDFAAGSHHITEKADSGMHSVILSVLKPSLLYFCQLQLRSSAASGYLYIIL